MDYSYMCTTDKHKALSYPEHSMHAFKRSIGSVIYDSGKEYYGQEYVFWEYWDRLLQREPYKSKEIVSRLREKHELPVMTFTAQFFEDFLQEYYDNSKIVVEGVVAGATPSPWWLISYNK